MRRPMSPSRRSSSGSPSTLDTVYESSSEEQTPEKEQAIGQDHTPAAGVWLRGRVFVPSPAWPAPWLTCGPGRQWVSRFAVLYERSSTHGPPRLVLFQAR